MNNLEYYNKTNFSNLLSKNIASTVSDYVSEKQNIVHEKLVLDALKQVLEYIKNNGLLPSTYTLSEFLDEYNFIENINKEFYLAPKVVFIKKKFPYTKFTIDLTDFWNDFQMKDVLNSNIEEKLIDEEAKNYLEIIYIDYAKGKTKLRDKSTNEEYWVDNKYISNDTKVSKDILLNETFGKQLNRF